MKSKLGRLTFVFVALVGVAAFGQGGRPQPGRGYTPGAMRGDYQPNMGTSVPQSGSGYRPPSNGSEWPGHQNDPLNPRPERFRTDRANNDPNGSAIPGQPGYRNPLPGDPDFSPYRHGRTEFNNPFYHPHANPHHMHSQYDFNNPPSVQVHSDGLNRPGDPWQQANPWVHNRDIHRVQTFVDQQLQADRSLGNMMNAVSAFEQMNASRSHFATYRTQAFEMAQQQVRSGANTALPYVAVAKFSLEDNNDAMFRNSADELRQKFPNHQYSHYFNGILALKNQDWKTAEQSLIRAREMGVPEESVAGWLKLAIDNQRWIWQYAWVTLWVVVAWLGGLAFLYIAGKTLSAMTLRFAEQCDPHELTKRQVWIRKMYRQLINLAGLYYYVSLPMVLLLSVALPLTVGYALLNVPILNLWLVVLVLLVSVGSILTAWSGLRACFVSLDRRIPGRTIARDEHPRLWQLVDEVAQQVGTRPVDEIYLTPTADIAVTEQGGFLEQMNDRGRRVLILGVGVLDGFSQQAFRSVLAHEYGHFLNRDTAGGDVALRVNAAMEAFAIRIIERGPIRWWHVAVQFLQFYYGMFNRLTFGASRLQEMLADRVAVLAYGPRSMRDGLTHAIRRTLEFDHWTTGHLETMVGNREAATSFYQSNNAAEPNRRFPLEAGIHEILNRPTTSADTHPSPRDRFAFAEKVAKSASEARRSKEVTSEPQVWDLFERPADTRRHLHADVAKLLAEEAKLIGVVNRHRLDVLNGVVRRTGRPEPRYFRAKVQCDLGQFEEALKDINVLLQKFAPHLDIRMAKVSILQSLKKPDEAANELEAIMATHTDCKREPSLQLLLADLNRQAERYDKAEQMLNACLLVDIKSIPARIARGLLLTQTGRPEDAINDFSIAIQEMPYASDAYVDRAMAFRAKGDRANAVRDLQTAIENNCISPRAHRELARWLVEEDPDQALRHATLACESTVGWNESLRVLVEVGRQGNRHAQAAAILDELISRIPTKEQDAWSQEARQLRAESGEPLSSSTTQPPPATKPPLPALETRHPENERRQSIYAVLDRPLIRKTDDYNCACGQTFPLQSRDGTPRTACPVCRNPITTEETASVDEQT